MINFGSSWPEVDSELLREELSMSIRLVNHSDIPKWLLLSQEYDCYVKELVQDLSEWYDGNDTSPAFGDYIKAKIAQQEAFMAVDTLNNCLGIIAISKKNNRVTFFAVSHNTDFYSVGKELLQYALDILDDSNPIFINEIASSSPHTQKHGKLYTSLGFECSFEALENGVPVKTYIKSALRFTTGDIEEALLIMREAAQWLIDIGKPMWDIEEFTRDHYTNPVDEFIVLYSNNESIATGILSFEDKFFWPNIPANTSGFIHKLAVKRRYAGQDMIAKLINHAVEKCKTRGVSALRLDCDAERSGLCALYERYGFLQKEVKTFDSKKLGKISVAYYELFF